MTRSGRSLVTRLTGAFGALAVAVAAASGTLAWWLDRDLVLQSVEERLAVAAELQEQALLRWIGATHLELRALAGTPDVWPHLDELLAAPEDSLSGRQARAALAAQLATVQSRQGVAEALLLSIPGGQVLASSRRESEGTYRTRHGYFLQGRGAPTFEGVYESPETGRPAATAAAPVVDRTGRPVAVLALHLDLGVLEQLLGPGALASAETFLVDRNHTPFAADRYRTAEFPRGLHSPAVAAAVAGGRGTARYVNHRGAAVVGTYRWLPEPGLALITEIPAAEALAPVVRLSWAVVLVGLALGLAGTAAGRVLARRIANPILEVAAAAERVAAGDRGVQARVRSSDEVGSLTTSFNRMAREVQGLTAALEEKVADLEASQAALRASEERYRVVLEGTRDAVYLLRLGPTPAENRLEFANAAVAEALGVGLDEVYRDPGLGPRAVHPDDAPTAAAATRHLVTRGEDTVCRYRLRNQGTGAWRWFEDRASAVRDATGRVVGIHAVARDVTDQVQAEETREQSARQERLAAVGQLAAGVAHDFNNILMALMGNAELLEEEPGLSPEGRARAGVILAQGGRAAALVRQILDFGRASLSRPEAVELGAFAAATAELLRRTIPESIDLRVRTGGEPTWVQVDPGQLQQIALNLALNSRDAMPEGGALTLATGELTVAEGEPPPVPDLEPGRWAWLRVTDTGSGIPPEHRPRIFEPFFTTKGPGRGSGLGLAQVYGLVRKHGGRIGLETPPGGGTSFQIYLPAAEAPVAPRPTPATVRPPQGAGQTVLLVEDDEGVRAVVRDLVESLGYRVREAADGRAALARCAEGGEAVAVVLTDWVMPGLGGEPFLRELAAHHPGLPVVVMSGYPKGEVPGGLARQVAARLEKPVRLAALAQALRGALGGDW